MAGESVYAHLIPSDIITMHTCKKIIPLPKVFHAGDVIGFMGRTGYSDKENVNNISAVHLHFGMQLIFEESQKECLSEIWIDVYDIVRLLSSHRSDVRNTKEGWQRRYPYRDLDVSSI